MDRDDRKEDFYYTEPIFINPTANISYTIEVKSGIDIPAISIIGLDTNASNLQLTYIVPATKASQNNFQSNIIKRAEWGADETLRYKDSQRWKTVLAKIEDDKDKPKSDATIKYEARVQDIRSHLAINFPEQDKTIETIKTEDGHPLVWPIEKTKQVERIVIHHTAENNKSDKDDFALIRGIYYYHAIVRGWGDI
jgi:hypothetical protein